MDTNTFGSAQSGAGKRKRADDIADDTASDLFCTPAPRTRIKSEEPETGNDLTEDQLDSIDDFSSKGIDGDGFYCEAKEPFPRHAAYDREIPLIKEAFAALAEQADKVLKNQCSSKDVQKLRSNAKAVASIPASKAKMIGLLGDAGMGTCYAKFGSEESLIIDRQELPAQHHRRHFALG